MRLSNSPSHEPTQGASASNITRSAVMSALLLHIAACTTNITNNYGTSAEGGAGGQNSGTDSGSAIKVVSTTGDLVTGVDANCKPLPTADGSLATAEDNQCTINDPNVTSSVVCDSDTCVVTGGGNLTITSDNCFRAASTTAQTNNCDWGQPDQCLDLQGDGVQFGDFVNATKNANGQYEIQDNGAGHDELKLMKGCSN